MRRESSDSATVATCCGGLSLVDVMALFIDSCHSCTLHHNHLGETAPGESARYKLTVSDASDTPCESPCYKHVTR